MNLKLIFNRIVLVSIGCIYFSAVHSQTQIGLDIDGEAARDQSGFTVSLSSDSSIVAIGAPRNNGNGINSGQVRVYKYISGTWIQIGSDIDGEAAGDESGWAVSLSSNGSTVAIGAMYNAGNGTDAGQVRVYENISGTWTQVGSDIDGEAANNGSGGSVSLSSDGSTVAIGAYANSGNGNQSGHVRIYSVTTCTTTSSTDTIISCGPYTWTDGNTYTSSNNTAKDTFVNAAGCDSVVTLNLTIIDIDKLISNQSKDQSVDVNRSTNIIVISGYGDVAAYQWQLDDGTGFKDLSNAGQYSGVLTDTLLVSNITLSNDGEIFRCLVTVNDCSDTSETVLLIIGKADVSKRSLTKDYAVYPNPTKGVVFISTKESLLGTSYTVYSSSGALIRNGSITSEITTLDVQDLQEGIYFIQLGDNIQQSFKIIKH